MPRPGEILREARLARELAIEDVERATRIGRRYLQALEEQDTAALPAPVYARGFLRSYARYLGLDADDLVTRFFPVDEPASDQSPLYPEPARQRRSLLRSVRDWAVGMGVLGLLSIAFVLGVPALSYGGSSAAPQNQPDNGSMRGGRALPIETPSSGDRPRTLDAPTVAPLNAGTMPDLRGREVAEALGEVTALGVPFIVIQTPSDRVEAGKVLQQVPPPRAKIDNKTSVTLVVSSGQASGESR